MYYPASVSFCALSLCFKPVQEHSWRGCSNDIVLVVLVDFTSLIAEKSKVQRLNKVFCNFLDTWKLIETFFQLEAVVKLSEKAISKKTGEKNSAVLDFKVWIRITLSIIFAVVFWFSVKEIGVKGKFNDSSTKNKEWFQRGVRQSYCDLKYISKLCTVANLCNVFLQDFCYCSCKHLGYFSCRNVAAVSIIYSGNIFVINDLLQSLGNAECMDDYSTDPVFEGLWLFMPRYTLKGYFWKTVTKILFNLSKIGMEPLSSNVFVWQFLKCWEWQGKEEDWGRYCIVFLGFHVFPQFAEFVIVCKLC